MNRITGSGAIVAAVRLAIAVIPNSKLSRRLVFAKNNLGIDDTHCLVTKQGHDLEIYSEPPDEIDDTKTGEAERFLLDLFKNGEDILARDIYQDGEAKGFSDSLLKKAKSSLRIKARQTKDGWVWRR